MSAYKGKETYIFVSYAREDGERVLPIIENMQIAGFRVRYSENTKDEMLFSIDDGLEKSSTVLVFLSPNAVDDVNARKEISYAFQNRKEMLICYLQEINSQYGLGKQLKGLASLHQSQYKTEIGFLNDLRRLNVAITSAKRKLIVVGNSATLNTNPTYKKFIKTATYN
jgi:hypothetical protein